MASVTKLVRTDPMEKLRMKKQPTDPIVEFSTLVEILRWRAIQQPELRAYTYLVDGEPEGDHLTYAALDCQARSIAALLQSYRAGGERALLLYPAGLDFIAAFFGCLYAGVIAVPLPPPNLAQPQRTLPGFAPSSGMRSLRWYSRRHRLSPTPRVCSRRLPSCRRCAGWPPTRLPAALAQEWRDPAVSGNTLALLQYTSGSTAEPKGVMISHGNLLHNSAYINRLLRAHAGQSSRSLGCRPSTTWDLPTESFSRCTRDVRVT